MHVSPSLAYQIGVIALQNRQIQLASRPGPQGPAASHFNLVETEIPEIVPGQILLETLYLSLDPYMRAGMYEGGNYAPPTPLGAPMPGATVSRVQRSRNPQFHEGDIVESWHGWQSHHVTDAKALRAIDPAFAPASTALGVLGMPGHTGYGGLLRYGKPHPGETVLVSAAAGAVGSVVGQVARIKGCRTVGIAGGPDKCRYIVDELGFDAAVDHRSQNLRDDLAAACPEGVDVYFDNVGGEVFAAVIPLLNNAARVLVCGTISVDRNQPAPAGRDRLQMLHSAVLVRQLTIQGFLYAGLLDMTEEFRRDVSGWIRSGQLKYREHVVEGLENAPEAFLGLFRGQNFGKLIVRVAATT